MDWSNSCLWVGRKKKKNTLSPGFHLAERSTCLSLCVFTVHYSCEEKWLQQFVLWAISYLQSDHRKNEQSVIPLTFRAASHSSTSRSVMQMSRGTNFLTCDKLRSSSSVRERMLHLLSHFADIIPAQSALDMPEMFTRAMKVGTLFLCYKQIFPFLATAVKGLRNDSSPRPVPRSSGSAQGAAAQIKQHGNTWQPFDHILWLISYNWDCCLTDSKK